MSVKVMSRVWEHSKQKANKLLALLALADNANDDGWAYPGQYSLARKCRVEKRGMQKLLDQLESADEIVIYNRIDEQNPELHFTNVYHLPKYGSPDALPPKDLRGTLHPRQRGSVQSDTGVVNSGTLPSEPPDTTVMSSDSPGSVQPDAGVVSGDSPKPSLNPLTDPLLEPSTEPVAVVEKIDQTHWNAAFQQLENQLDRNSFEAWVRNVKLLRVEREDKARIFVIGTPSAFALEMLSTRIHRMIVRILSDVCGVTSGLRVELIEAATEVFPAVPSAMPTPEASVIRSLFTQFIGAITPENEKDVADIEARYDAEAFGSALEIMAGKQARGLVDDPLAYTLGILRNQYGTSNLRKGA